MFQGIFKSAINDANKNYIFGTGSIPIQIKTAQLATFADGSTKQQGYQVAEVNKLISTMLTGWDANGNKPKSMSDNYLELILSCDNGFVVKKKLQFPHIITWQDDNTQYQIADIYKQFSIDNWLKADDFENPDITLVVEPTDEILTTSTATPPKATTTNSGKFYLYYRNLPVGVNRIHIDFHVKAKTEPIDFDLEVVDGLSWKDAQAILASNEQAKINVLLSGIKDVYKFTGAEGNFEEITMHEWSALYQQIISLNPSNKFTHDLYFYLYEESEISTKLTELEKNIIGVDGNFISGKYLNANYQEIDDEGYCISDYIEVLRYNRVIWNYGLNKLKGKIVIYNADKEPINYYSTSTTGTATKNLAIPDAGTAYVRISFGKDVEGTGAIIIDGNSGMTIREWHPVARVIGLKEEINNISTRITNAEGNIESNTKRIIDLEDKSAQSAPLNSVSNNGSLAYLYRKEIAEQYTEYLTTQTSDIDDSYIDNRLESIPDGKHIIFFTDYHYQTNSHQSITMMEYVKAKLGGDVKVLFGGDYTDREPTKQSGLSIMRKFSRMCKNAFGAENFLPCLGDHDTNLANRTENLEQYALSYKDLRSYIGYIGGKANFENRDAELESFVSEEDMQEMKDWMKLHYYVDSENEKIRFIVLAVAYHEYPTLLKKYFGNPDYANFAPYRVLVALQAEWIYDVMMSTPEGWDVVMLAHKIAYGAGQTKTGTEDWSLMNMTGACVELARLFKTKSNSSLYYDLPAEDLVIGSSIDRFKTFLSDGRNHVFDFSNAPDIRHMVVLCGDNHWDSVTIRRNGGNIGFVNGGKISAINYTNGDIPIICTTCDDNKRRNQPLDATHSSSVDRTYADNTLDSVAFDVITLTDDKIYCTRFGHTECEPADYWSSNPELASRERHIEGAADRVVEFIK